MDLSTLFYKTKILEVQTFCPLLYVKKERLFLVFGNKKKIFLWYKQLK